MNDGMCMVCNQFKRVIALLVINDMPICDECGEWLATLERDDEQPTALEAYRASMEEVE
ncbi:MAG: hypothetical protein ACYTBJ_27410 [Planctomycetota bacterium]|jgi:hypothetical protein